MAIPERRKTNEMSSKIRFCLKVLYVYHSMYYILHIYTYYIFYITYSILYYIHMSYRLWHKE